MSLRPALRLLAFSLVAAAVPAQRPSPGGPRHVDPRWDALVHATLVPAPGERIDDATVVLRDGVIVSIEASAAPPRGARIWDCTGRHVYAGLVDACVPIDAPMPEPTTSRDWGAVIAPQRSALHGPWIDEDARRELRALGFTAAAVAPRGGIFRGTAALVLLDEPGEDEVAQHAAVVREHAYHMVAFERGAPGGPSSRMGAVAAVRQTLLDADWHAHNAEVYARHPTGLEPPAVDPALAALADPGLAPLPLVFDVADELEALTALRLGAEHDREVLVLGSGTEYRRLAALASENARLILPLNFPPAPPVGTVAEAESVSLRELMAWEQAPTNPRRVCEAGLLAALTTYRLEERGEFRRRLRTAIHHGLTEDQALAMLTVNPAAMLGVDDRLGTVAVGKIANLVVADGPLFAAGTEILDVWIRGRHHRANDPRPAQLDGRWTLGPAEATPGWGIEGTLRVDGQRVALELGGRTVPAHGVVRTVDRLDFLLDGAALGGAGILAVHAVREGDALFGETHDEKGRVLTWGAQRARPAGDEGAAAEPDDPDRAQAERPKSVAAAGQGAAGDRGGEAGRTGEQEPGDDPAEGDKDEDEGDDEDEDEDEDVQEAVAAARAAGVPEALPTPFGAFGRTEPPARQNLLVTGVTLWGVGDVGRLENAAIATVDGRVGYVGQAEGAPRAPDAVVIHADGKHVTPGLIDCHSHTGMAGGLNETTQAVTSEVRVLDCLDPDDINWYRQLAGGVTMAQQLHGSANPIGGQSNVVKLRWGVAEPSEMLASGAAPGIKFALGENVTRERQPPRYPGSRMGVEGLLRDRLLAAREYSLAQMQYRRASAEERARTYAPRRDLELEALADVLSGLRLVHCHSYRQDEILMICRLAQELGFKIGTLQHGLECYKVAEVVRQSALGASVFSDWWAYKFEVFDAIPYNGSILHKVGVTVSFHSDSSELARRLNTEAAKAMKYGGLDAVTALRFVTAGPAAQLRLDQRVGTLAPGMDADFAIWSQSPLSSFALCEATYIDSTEYFSIERDRALRDEAQAERRRIIQKIRQLDRMRGSKGEAIAKASDKGGRARFRAGSAEWTASSAGRPASGGAWRQHPAYAPRAAESMHPGDCGCGLQEEGQ